MKKILFVLLILVALILAGCAKTDANTDSSNNVATNTESSSSSSTNSDSSTANTDITLTIGTDEISNDIDSISAEIASLDINDSGNVVKPISEADLTD